MEILIPVTCFDIFEAIMKVDTFDILQLSRVFGQGKNLAIESKFNLLGIESFNAVANLKTNALFLAIFLLSGIITAIV